MNTDRIILVSSIIFFVAVSIIVYFYAPDMTAHFEGDSVRYDFIAQHFGFLKTVPLEALGYPFFLFLIYTIFGHSMGAVVTVQVILSICCLFLLRRIAGKLGGIWAQIVVTLLWTLNLGFLIYSQLLLIEVMVALFYLFFIERVIAFYEQPSFGKIAQSGLILGLSMLFKPAALFYALCFTIFLLFMRKQSIVYRFIGAFIFIASFYVPVLGYMAGNYWYFGQFIICPVMNINLFFFFYPKLLAALREQGIVVNRLISAINYDVLQQQITAQSQVNLMKLMLEYPFITMKIWLINMIKSFVGLYVIQWKLYFELSDKATSFFVLPGNWLAKMKGYVYVGTERSWLHYLGWYEVSYLIVEYSLAAFGALYLFMKRKIWLFFFAISFIVYCALITGPDGSGRFRMMFEPWLLALASLGLVWLFTKNKKKVFV